MHISALNQTNSADLFPIILSSNQSIKDKKEEKKKKFICWGRFELRTLILYKNGLIRLANDHFTNRFSHVCELFLTAIITMTTECLRSWFSDRLRTCCFTYFIMYLTNSIAPPCQVTSSGLYKACSNSKVVIGQVLLFSISLSLEMFQVHEQRL